MKRHKVRAGPVIVLLGLVSAWEAGAECKLGNMGTLPIENYHGRIATRAEINGHETRALINTGSWSSFVLHRAAVDAGLQPTEAEGVYSMGSKGQSPVRLAMVGEIRLGNFSVKDQRWYVRGDTKSESSDIGMYIGRDVFSNIDWEIDLANNQIIFWKATDCGNSPLAYWDENYMLAELEPSRDNFIMTRALINGRGVRASLSTATITTVLTLDAARPLGFKVGEPNVEKSTDNTDAYVYRVDVLEVGDLMVKNARLRVLDLGFEAGRPKIGSRLPEKNDRFPDMLIGVDFLRAHRLLVANSQGYMYFTYNGGTIFQTQTPAEATEFVTPDDIPEGEREAPTPAME